MWTGNLNSAVDRQWYSRGTILHPLWIAVKCFAYDSPFKNVVSVNTLNAFLPAVVSLISLGSSFSSMGY